MTLLLQTEDLVAERRAVRVADIAAATQAALQQLERLQAVAAAMGGPGGPASVSAPTPAVTATVAVDPVDTADIQQQLLAAAETPPTSISLSSGVAGSPLPAVTGPAILGPPSAAVPYLAPSGDSNQTVEGRSVALDKAADILVRKLTEKERAIAQQYRAAARQAIQSMQADVLRTLARHDDLRPDIFLERLRRILPSEYLAAWSAWTGIFSLISASDNVMFAMWAVYSVMALGYVYLRLVKDRRMKDAVDSAALPRVVPMGSAAAAATAAGGRGGTAGLKTVAVKADTLSMVASGVEAVSISRFDSEKPEANDDAADSATDDDESGSDVMSTVDEEIKRGRRFGGGGKARGGGGKGGGEKAARPARRTPRNIQLFLQAFVSALSFLLLSAFAAGIHTTIGAPVWVFFAPVAPFVLFAQFVLPDGLVSRR